MGGYALACVAGLVLASLCVPFGFLLLCPLYTVLAFCASLCNHNGWFSGLVAQSQFNYKIHAQLQYQTRITYAYATLAL